MNVDPVALEFRTALETAYTTGERDSVHRLLSDDVEWVTPQRTLSGIDAVKEQLTWGSVPDKLEAEFEDVEWQDLGDGRVGFELRQVYRMRETGDFAYERRRKVELTIEGGKISRYEMRIVG